MNEGNTSTSLITVASGKGGVGKTTLALALAHELGTGKNDVLLVDIDFSNRGLSELCSAFERASPKPKKTRELLINAPLIETLDVEYLDVTQNITVASPSFLNISQLNILDSLPLKKIKKVVSDLVQPLSDQSKFDVVIFDCRGGRDKFSQAASIMSNHVFVINSDDKATFFGTKLFLDSLQNLKNELDTQTPQIHLLFNRVSGKVSARTISYWYKRHFRKYCEEDDVLSILPRDPEISISASDYIFPTSKFQYSSMAEKTRLIAYDLFKKSSSISVAPESRFVGKWLSLLIRPNRTILDLVLGLRIPLTLVVLTLAVIYVFFVFGYFVGPSEFQAMVGGGVKRRFTR